MVSLGAHVFVQVLGQHTNQIVFQIEYLDSMSVALNVNIVLERWRQEIHWDVSVENAFYTHDLSSVFVKSLHFEYIVLLASMLGKDEVVEGVHVKVHVL